MNTGDLFCSSYRSCDTSKIIIFQDEYIFLYCGIMDIYRWYDIDCVIMCTILSVYMTVVTVVLWLLAGLPACSVHSVMLNGGLSVCLSSSVWWARGLGSSDTVLSRHASCSSGIHTTSTNLPWASFPNYSDPQQWTNKRQEIKGYPITELISPLI